MRSIKWIFATVGVLCLLFGAWVATSRELARHDQLKIVKQRYEELDRCMSELRQMGQFEAARRRQAANVSVFAQKNPNMRDFLLRNQLENLQGTTNTGLPATALRQIESLTTSMNNIENAPLEKLKTKADALEKANRMLENACSNYGDALSNMQRLCAELTDLAKTDPDAKEALKEFNTP